ncbi:MULTISPECIES: hypothetical protein [unclassified Mycolicibacterium]|uniref:hypothetical protein n=1 Tax=unclassified Mycolicibacterium TaxID=2636767 RepID=UPI0012DC4F9F|nr:MULTISPECIES: hypothetical protein [unclassified Mycolicibacterium]MUL98880.1 hypothetical protein [Mycolicibacterium sp. CBMA 334]MUM28988.1 hypothetical protein [Mycolicibacterium sp. CBMA 295]MUL81069.1 hypothetical protein [Mycolicibacterium sp. CBMA 329]MUL86835.1 hypothetical protein [Mycolicibacterium sp. CBMA 331]MUM42900.1 hypothetical protein [Mycolicibacterium sp. CBMA 294]
MAVVPAWVGPGRLGLVAMIVGAAVAVGLPSAHAYPPGFPDLDTFDAVDPGPFTHSYDYGRGGKGTLVSFGTPDGVHCNWQQSSNVAKHPEIDCIGNVPGVPAYVADRDEPGCTEVRYRGSWVGGADTYGFLHVYPSSGSCPSADVAQPSTVLMPGQKLISSNITCAVAGGNVTACIDPVVNRGFMLAPAGSWTF